MQQQNVINVEKLKELGTESPTAKDLFKLLAERRRGRQDTNMRRIRRLLSEGGTKVSVDDLADIFKKLQAAGAGKIVYGRRNKPTRFIWDWHLVSVAKAVNGEPVGEFKKQKAPRVKLPKLPASEPRLPVMPDAMFKDMVASVVSGEAKIVTQPKVRSVIVRRGDFEILLPLNMSKEEQDGVSQLLKNLPR